MWSRLFLICTLITIYFDDLSLNIPSQKAASKTSLSPTVFNPTPIITPNSSPQDIAHHNKMLTHWFQQESFHLNNQIIDYLVSILSYAYTKPIEQNNILTLIDYSKPASEKRLWVFDLNTQKLLFFTYVSHGLKSGTLESNYFSNRFDSKASSIGVYRTNKTYYGRHGLSLKLDGLEPGFNDNADSRAIVMHGGWYVEEPFILKYGRAGRSWGCPAISDQLVTPIINLIKDKSLFVVYYPNPIWIKRSKFLAGIQQPTQPHQESFIEPIHTSELRDDILLAQLVGKNKYHESEAILVLPTDRYAELFQKSYPLNRMLRRQIENKEYIALSKDECNQLIARSTMSSNATNIYQDIALVVPEIVMSHGYYATEMRKINVGIIKNIRHQLHAAANDIYTLDLDNQSDLRIKTSHKFIRWLGL
jgi:hypothetical protein